MPFTPAHPAILLTAHAVPRKYISWTALIIGSMVPDMEYFLFLNPGSRMSHTLYGVLNFNLPMTVLLAMAWHHFAGPVLLRALPFWKKSYTQIHSEYAEWLSKNWLVFIISALIGIGSHLVLDGFCHHRGFMVQRIAWLQEMTTVAGYPVRRCYVVWYALSLLGLIAMALAVVDFKSVFSKDSWKQFFRMRKFFMRIILVTMAIAGVRIMAGLTWNVFRHLVVIAIGAFFYATLLVTMYEKYGRKKSGTYNPNI